MRPEQIPETTTLFLISFSQLLMCAVLFNIRSKYRQSITANVYLMSALVLLTALYLLLLFLPHGGHFMGGFMQLAYDQVAYQLRFWILGLNVTNAALAFGAYFGIEACFSAAARRRTNSMQDAAQVAL